MPTRIAALRATIAAGLIAAAAPFLWLACYAHAQNDDYVFAMHTRILGWAAANADWYRNWSGRYLSNALASASPLALGWPQGYSWSAVAIIAVLAAAILALATAVAGREEPLGRRAAFAAALVVLLLDGMPDLAQGVYWTVGAVTYLLGSAFLLLALAAAIAAERSPTAARRWALAAGASLAAVAAAGTNEVSGVQVAVLLGVALAVASSRRRAVAWPIALALVFALAGVAADAFAPGARARLAAEGGRPLGVAMLDAMRESGAMGWRWVTRGPLVPFLALLFPALVPVARRRGGAALHPALAAAVLGVLVVLSFVPSFLAAGRVEPRTANVVHALFVVGAIAVAFLAAGRVAARPGAAELRVPAALRWALVAAGMVLTAFPGGNLRGAWADLASGAARRYDAEQRLRYRLISTCAGAVCVVPPLSEPPRTLFFFENALDDAGDDVYMHRYKDFAFAGYFYRQRIMLIP